MHHRDLQGLSLYIIARLGLNVGEFGTRTCFVYKNLCCRLVGHRHDQHEEMRSSIFGLSWDTACRSRRALHTA
jgi:hypothetical protein